MGEVNYHPKPVHLLYQCLKSFCQRRQDNMYDTSLKGNIYDTFLKDNMYDTSSKDNMYDTSLKDNMYDTSLKDNMYETSSKDNMYDTSLKHKISVKFWISGGSSENISIRNNDGSFGMINIFQEHWFPEDLRAKLYIQCNVDKCMNFMDLAKSSEAAMDRGVSRFVHQAWVRPVQNHRQILILLLVTIIPRGSLNAVYWRSQAHLLLYVY